MLFKELVCRYRWGGMSLVALAVSVLSGLPLALQYDVSEAFYSVSTMEILAPFGIFWRSLHFYSSQVFLGFLFLHLVAMLLRDDLSMERDEWLRLICCLPVSVLLLFSGYVLRGDATGRAAGAIAGNIVLAVPLLGGALDAFLFAIEDSGLRRVYGQHLAGLGLLFGALAWRHLCRYRIQWLRFAPLVVAMPLFSIVVAAPLEPERLGQTLITGPWFFVGVQELLRFVPVVPAGVVYPLLVVILLCLLAPEDRKDKKGVRRLLILIGIWSASYLFLTLAGFVRSWL